MSTIPTSHPPGVDFSHLDEVFVWSTPGTPSVEQMEKFIDGASDLLNEAVDQLHGAILHASALDRHADVVAIDQAISAIESADWDLVDALTTPAA